MEFKKTMVKVKNAVVKAAPYVGVMALGAVAGYLYRSKHSVTNKYADMDSFDDVAYIIGDIFEEFLDEHDNAVTLEETERDELQARIADEIREHRLEFAME